MSKKDIDNLVQQCEELGWKVTTPSKGFTKILPPEGDAIIAPTTANGRALANFRAELRRAGFNPEAVAAAKAEKAETALVKDRRRNDAALARAARRAQDAALAPAEKPTPPAKPKAAPTLANPFSPPPLSDTPLAVGDEVINEFRALKGYTRQAVSINQKQAADILAYAKEQQQKENGCRQRKLYPTNVAKIRQGMELGEWELNPADALVFCKEHKSIVNGGHRMEGLRTADSEFLEAFYPGAELDFEVVTGFPCRLSHIFDQGKSRSGVDALEFDGQVGWTNLACGALRMVLQFDRSFEVDEPEPWSKWRKQIVTNSQLVSEAGESYKGLLETQKIANRAYTRSRVTRSASMAAAFLIERDNPGGNPAKGRTNELFWKGVCGEDDMSAGDPRMAIIRVAMRTGAKYRYDNGPTMLAHLLKGYSNYMIGDKRVDISTVDKDKPMPPVWQPGMKWIKGELRRPLVGG